MGIDFDNVAKRLDELFEFLNSLPQPCLPYHIRKSSGGKGLHIKLHCNDKKYREKWDDPERLKVDRIRAKYGFTSDILDDVKSIRKERRVSGKWIKIENRKFKNKEELQKFITEELK